MRSRVICAAALLFLAATSARAATNWTAGTNYFLISPVRPMSLPAGKVAVTEVFSYGCPACNEFVPTMHKLKRALPANAVVNYVPASFNPSEDWPMLQLAFCTAETLGVAEQTHDAMFDAVWKTGELAIIDPATKSLKKRLPTIEDAAAFYAKHANVPAEKFLGAAKSFAVDMKVRSAEAAVVAFGVDRTPSIVVNGKYRLYAQSAGGYDQMIELVQWLVAKESK